MLERCVAALGKRPKAAAPLSRADEVAPKTPKAPGKCLIKGNISSNGKIYHVPGSRSYDKTVIDDLKASAGSVRRVGGRHDRA
jgi:hypothetical protein